MMSDDEENQFPGFQDVTTKELVKQMADQNKRLLQLLERLSTQPAASASNPAPVNVQLQQRRPEQIIESLSSVIKEFSYDPEAGMTFDRWYNKYDDLFEEDGKELNDAAKIRLLLRSLSVPVHEQFISYLLPKRPRDFTFKEVVSKLKAIFGVQRSLFSKRYDCLRLSKNDSDDYITFASLVNRHCEEFELPRLTIDQFKALVFICGLQSPKESEVRTRLLSKLESEGSKSTSRHSSANASGCRISSTTLPWLKIHPLHRYKQLRHTNDTNRRSPAHLKVQSHRQTQCHPLLVGSAEQCTS